MGIYSNLDCSKCITFPDTILKHLELYRPANSLARVVSEGSILQGGPLQPDLSPGLLHRQMWLGFHFIFGELV